MRGQDVVKDTFLILNFATSKLLILAHRRRGNTSRLVAEGACKPFCKRDWIDLQNRPHFGDVEGVILEEPWTEKAAGQRRPPGRSRYHDSGGISGAGWRAVPSVIADAGQDAAYRFSRFRHRWPKRKPDCANYQSGAFALLTLYYGTDPILGPRWRNADTDHRQRGS
jgi:hypothetical protein